MVYIVKGNKMLNNLMKSIKKQLKVRLKPPYVSKKYGKEETENLLKGIEIAIQNGFSHPSKITSQQIIDIFNAMNPNVRAIMKEPLRRSPVSFIIDDHDAITKTGLQQFLTLVDGYKGYYGPQFDIHDMETNTVKHFQKCSEMLNFYKCSTYNKLAAVLLKKIRSTNYKINFIPTYDSMNPFYDHDPQNDQQAKILNAKHEKLASLKVYNDVKPIFKRLLAEFNEKESPSIKDISLFVKKMFILHPFLDGNGRTFTLGVLNQLLIKHHQIYCIKLEPVISLMTLKQIEKHINKNKIDVPKNVKQFFESKNFGTVELFQSSALAKSRLKQKVNDDEKEISPSTGASSSKTGMQ